MSRISLMFKRFLAICSISFCKSLPTCFWYNDVLNNAALPRFLRTGFEPHFEVTTSRTEVYFRPKLTRSEHARSESKEERASMGHRHIRSTPSAETEAGKVLCSLSRLALSNAQFIIFGIFVACITRLHFTPQSDDLMLPSSLPLCSISQFKADAVFLLLLYAIISTKWSLQIMSSNYLQLRRRALHCHNSLPCRSAGMWNKHRLVPVAHIRPGCGHLR